MNLQELNRILEDCGVREKILTAEELVNSLSYSDHKLNKEMGK